MKEVCGGKADADEGPLWVKTGATTDRSTVGQKRAFGASDLPLLSARSRLALG